MTTRSTTACGCTIREWGGLCFAGQVQLALKSIKTNPHFASFRYDDVRCAQGPKFPYLVHYTIDETTRTVLIAAVYGTRQEPFWE